MAIRSRAFTSYGGQVQGLSHHLWRASGSIGKMDVPIICRVTGWMISSVRTGRSSVLAVQYWNRVQPIAENRVRAKWLVILCTGPRLLLSLAAGSVAISI